MAKALYLHVPFCKSICYYCDFKRTLYNEELANSWLARIEEDLKVKDIELLSTIYIGGGTPTSLTYSQLEKLLKLVQPYINEVEEFTIESNIESLDNHKIRLLKQYGVNRISLGIQSLNDYLLKEMNRKHNEKQIYEKIEEIYHEGITNISVDMIYGFDVQTLKMWEDDLYKLVENKYISHISLYSLTIEENSVFGKMNRETCDPTLEAEMYDRAIEILEEHGFKQYEVANFAKNGRESKHNKMYWEYNDFYGIGLGASGKEENVRYDHSGTLKAYIENRHIINREELDKEDLIFENIMMSLRLRKGLDMRVFENRYKVSILDLYKKEIAEEIKNNNLIIEDGYLITTKKGMFCLHDILVKFLR